MSNDNPSIEDLLSVKKSSSKDEETITEKFTEKMGEIASKTAEELTAEKASAAGLPYIDFADQLIDREALGILSKEEAIALRSVVFVNQNHQMRMATIEPTDAVKQKFSELLKEYHAEGVLYLISEQSFKKAVDVYNTIPKKREIKKTVQISAADLEKYKADVADLTQLPQRIKDIPLSDVIAIILAAAIESGASDIHIESESDGIKLRFRLDGVLHEMAEIGQDMWKELISRVKLMSHLKLNVTEVPQDGRITIELPDDRLDVRVSTLPTAYGESVVMRLLRSSAVGLNFKDLGLRGKAFADLKREIERPNGMILTTGPTGSGKTTSLYAMLNKLNNEQTKIITLEDPVEYRLPGVNQSQVDRDKGYDFAKGLRSLLRQDPDVVMVGEIRDLETADVAINGALTGHLVLSTLHTNDASGAIPRFLAMGVKPFLLAPAINAVIGQRLVRKICDACKEPLELDTATLTKVINIIQSIPENSGFAVDKGSDDLHFFHGKGCEACDNDGYTGRIGIFEVFTMTPEIEKMILSGQVSEYDIHKLAQAGGMITMAQDGVLKAMDGMTTVAEVFRVTEQ